MYLAKRIFILINHFGLSLDYVQEDNQEKLKSLIHMMQDYRKLTPNGYKALSVFSAFLLLVGSFTQLLVLLVMLNREYRKKVLTPYFLSIVASNSLLLYGSLPTTLVSSLMNGWIFNKKVCYLVGFVSGTGSISMIATMAVITVKMYLLAKNRPFSGNQIKPDTSYGKILLGVWTYSVCAMLPPVTGLTEMKIEGAGTNCVPNWSPTTTNGRIYVVFLLTLAYLIPVSVATIYLLRIRRELTFDINEANYYFVNLCFRNLRSINKMCILAVVFFATSWFPYAILVTICIFEKKYLISAEIEMGPTLLSKTSAIFNPFIYAVANPRFRKSILHLLKIKFLFSNYDDNEMEVGSVFVLNEIGTNKKIFGVKKIMKAKRDVPNVNTEEKQETNSRIRNSIEDKTSKERANAKSCCSKTKGFPPIKNTLMKETENCLSLSVEHPRKYEYGFAEEASDYRMKVTLHNVEEKKQENGRCFAEHRQFRDRPGFQSLRQKDLSGDESQKIMTSSAVENNFSLYKSSCSIIKGDKRMYNSKQRHKVGKGEPSSSSSALNISAAYRASPVTNKRFSENVSLPGSLSHNCSSK